MYSRADKLLFWRLLHRHAPYLMTLYVMICCLLTVGWTVVAFRFVGAEASKGAILVIASWAGLAGLSTLGNVFLAVVVENLLMDFGHSLPRGDGAPAAASPADIEEMNQLIARLDDPLAGTGYDAEQKSQ